MALVVQETSLAVANGVLYQKPHSGETQVPTEMEKMLAGELYDPFDPELVRARERARI